ncbi:MAG TPA: TadE/TadG family type IV pilus assembly protein [Gemmatimonadota bacterium]|nr:TadE/TadG family type IV pilus assembly protein [Gemmatimonadota bacterium]
MSRRLARRDAGQSLAEFAILLPILMGVVVGIFEFGRAWNIDQVLTNAAREGARLAVIPSSSTSDVVEAVEDRLAEAALDPALANIGVKGMGGGVGTPAKVEVSYPYQFTFLGPVMRLMGVGDGPTPGAITLSSRITMRNE